MKKFIISFLVLAVFILASCDNKNLFGRFHKAGSSSSIEVLLNDANTALEEDNPAKAKEIADKILAKDPGNSEALEISATAGLQEAGFDFGSILTTIMSSGDEADANSILDAFKNMDLNNVASAISDAVEKLGVIADGAGDGAIPAGDVAVNLNLGILELLNAAITIIDVDGDGIIIDDDNDVIQIDENYDIKIKVGTGTPKAVTDLTDDDINDLKDLNYVVDGDTVTLAEKLTASIDQMESAVDHLIVANEKAGIIEEGDDTSTITDMKESIDEMKSTLNEDLLDKLNADN